MDPMSIPTLLTTTALALVATALSLPESSDVASDLAGRRIADTPDGDSIEWVRSYSAALARARTTGKPIFLEFRCRP